MGIKFDAEQKYSPEKIQDWMVFRDTPDAKETIFALKLPSGLTVEDFVGLESAWKFYLEEIDKEFPRTWRAEAIVEYLRKNYAWEGKKKIQALTAYRDADRKGTAYKELRKLAERTEIVNELHKETEAKGKELKNVKSKYAERALSLDWIDPLVHRSLIASMGFEAFFRKYLWWAAI